MIRYEVRERCSCVPTHNNCFNPDYFYIWDNQNLVWVGEIKYTSFIEAYQTLKLLNKKHIDTLLGA